MVSNPLLNLSLETRLFTVTSRKSPSWESPDAFQAAVLGRELIRREARMVLLSQACYPANAETVGCGGKLYR